ncbi:MarR family winged helix-turn-helix transcriptional regulator [Paenibacillus sp. ACRRX]|uniref:MarR family winged helix-turn-helix transcriptional regulator n=1 Tax=Paenibacillus sp. ACRRX TaxID=2918206 RepID=UPI001EF56387|nr:MarR family winged helix-turn-helix transcriptional regulator [Paenibacillus sp. ACRRX]MCG7406226.1 MarR family winged helix-turn-helix transcriptional regulator [Paenibacillus sp. ACRRX]
MIGGARPEFSLQKSALLLRVELQRRIAEHHISFQQWAVMREIYAQEVKPDRNRKVTIAAIGARLYIDRPTMTGIVQRLISDGWIELLPDAQGEGSQRMILTAESLEKCTMWQEESAAVVGFPLSTFSNYEQQLMMELLQRMVYQMERGQIMQRGL